jgi:hypothetical protein
MMGCVFAIVITAIAGSFVQDLFLPKFLRQAEDPLPKEAEPETTEHSILAKVLDDMESLDLIKLSPNADKKPLVEPHTTEDQHMSEKAAA